MFYKLDDIFAEVKPELLTDAYMSIMVEKCIRLGICHAVHRHENTNNKHTKDYHPSTETSYIVYWDISNLYG